MLFYDWKKIFETSEGSALTIFLIFRMLTTNYIPNNKYDKMYKFASKSFGGESFLVHPDILLHHAYKYSYYEISQYLALASLRRYADYVATGETRLDLELCAVDLETFEENSLLDIEDGNIVFLYEEVNKEDIH